MNYLKHPKLRGLLDHPKVFNGVRWMIAGDQKMARHFVREELCIKSGEHVLDVCCGTGDFVPAVEGAYIGIDLNQRFVEFASRKYAASPNKKFLVADALQMQFESKSFDKALFINGLHHFPTPVAERVLEETARVTLYSVVIGDLVSDVSHPVKRALANLDRGDFLRPIPEKVRLIEKSFRIVKQRVFCTRLAEHVIFICEPKTV